jgi:hypothetical protein
MIGNAHAQITERPRPAEWDNLVKGGRFIDLFLPIAPIGPLTSQTWGAPNVIPRYVDNGIEDEVQNFGQVASKETVVKVHYTKTDRILLP